MTPDESADHLDRAVREVVASLEESARVAVSGVAGTSSRWECPRRAAHGALTTTVALRMAAAARDAGVPLSGTDLADALARSLRTQGMDATVAGPGFVNVVFPAPAAADVVQRMVESGPRRRTALGAPTTRETRSGTHPDGPSARRALGGPASPRSSFVDVAPAHRSRLDDHRREIAVEVLVRLSDAGGGSGPVRRRLGPVLGTSQDLADHALPVPGITGDALRIALLRVPLHDPVTVDPVVCRSFTEVNPWFRSAYAHATCRRLLRAAPRWDDTAPDLRGSPPEAHLVGLVADHDRLVGRAARELAPHLVVGHLDAVARAFAAWYRVDRRLPRRSPAPPDVDVDVQTLCPWIVEATRLVLADGLGLLGVTAPERL